MHAYMCIRNASTLLIGSYNGYIAMCLDCLLCIVVFSCV